MAKAATERQNLKQQAYQILKQKIITCEYAPGTMLNEAQIAAEHGFSRTPVREAISILEQEGFLTIVRNKGILVNDILLNDVMQIFQARIEVEPIVLRIAGQNIPKEDLIAWKEKFEKNESEPDLIDGFNLDTRMHMSLIECSKNVFIIDMMKKVYDKNMRVIISSPHNREHAVEARKEHIRILDTLIEGDVETAAQLMRTHIINCRKAALDSLYGV